MRSSHLRTFERSSVAVRRSTAARYRHCCRRYYAFYSGYGNLLLFYIQICHDGCSHCWITCCADVAYIAPCTYSIQSVQSIAKMTNDKMMMSFWYDKCTWGASWVYYTGLWFVGVFEMGGEWDWFLCLFFFLLLGMKDSSWFLNSISVEWHRMHLFSYPIITPCAVRLLTRPSMKHSPMHTFQAMIECTCGQFKWIYKPFKAPQTPKTIARFTVVCFFLLFFISLKSCIYVFLKSRR